MMPNVMKINNSSGNEIKDQSCRELQATVERSNASHLIAISRFRGSKVHSRATNVQEWELLFEINAILTLFMWQLLLIETQLFTREEEANCYKGRHLRSSIKGGMHTASAAP